MELGKTSIDVLPSTVKKIFLFLPWLYYCRALDLEKIQSAPYHMIKNIYLRFCLQYHYIRLQFLWLQYYYDAWDFEKFQSTPDTTEKKLFLTTVPTSHARKILIGTPSPTKKYIATALLWCTGLRKYCSVLC